MFPAWNVFASEETSTPKDIIATLICHAVPHSGIDVSIHNHEQFAYSVLADHFRPSIHQLAGKYAGADVEATSFGLNFGGDAPLRKSDGSISLQPISEHDSGALIAAGFTYLYLQADGQ